MAISYDQYHIFKICSRVRPIKVVSNYIPYLFCERNETTFYNATKTQTLRSQDTTKIHKIEYTDKHASMKSDVLSKCDVLVSFTLIERVKLVTKTVSISISLDCWMRYREQNVRIIRLQCAVRSNACSND